MTVKTFHDQLTEIARDIERESSSTEDDQLASAFRALGLSESGAKAALRGAGLHRPDLTDVEPLREVGDCRWCKQPALPGKPFCESCLDAINEVERERLSGVSAVSKRAATGTLASLREGDNPCPLVVDGRTASGKLVGARS